MFKKNSRLYYLCNIHAAMSIMGYWLLLSVLGLVLNQTSSVMSVVYEMLQLALAIFVILSCWSYILEKGKSFLMFFMFFMAIYTIRMLFDMIGGPFSLILPRSVFLKDFSLSFFGVFVSLYAIIWSRRYIDIELQVRLIFWMAFVSLVVIMLTLRSKGMLDSYEEDRVDVGRGVGSLAYVKIGAIEVLCALHLLLNSKKKSLLYVVGLVLGLWATFVAGSRGGLVALVIALGFWWIMSSRRNPLYTIVPVSVLILALMNIVPILNFLSRYFPVIGERLLYSYLENDQSGRDALRLQAIKLIGENPIFGYSYRLNSDLTGYGSHNGILDVLLAVGIPFGGMFLYFIYIKGLIMSAKLMRYREMFFPSVMLIFVLVASMSGSILDKCSGYAICIFGIVYYYYYPNIKDSKINNNK